LEGALAKEQYMEFCEHKVQSSETEEDKNLWSFLKVTTMCDDSSYPLMLIRYLFPINFLEPDDFHGIWYIVYISSFEW